MEMYGSVSPDFYSLTQETSVQLTEDQIKQFLNRFF